VTKIGEHRWNECERHSGRSYGDNVVGTVWSQAVGVPGEVEVDIVCTKCGKRFESAEDPEIAIDPDQVRENRKAMDHLFGIKPPADGSRVYYSDGVVAGAVEVYLSPLDGVRHGHEVMPGWPTALPIACVRREKIGIPTEIAHLGKNFTSKRFAYVLCDRQGRIIDSRGNVGAGVEP